MQAGFGGIVAMVVTLFLPQISPEQAIAIAAVLTYALSWIQNYGEWRGWWPAVGRSTEGQG